MMTMVKSVGGVVLLLMLLAMPSQVQAGSLSGNATYYPSFTAAFVTATFSGYPDAAYIECGNASTGSYEAMNWTPGSDPQHANCWISCNLGDIMSIVLYDANANVLASIRVASHR